MRSTKGCIKLVAAVLSFSCFFCQFVCWAQNPPTTQILRSQEAVERDKQLRDEIGRGEKTFIKKIIVKGVKLPNNRVEEIISPYKKHWLSKSDFDNIIASIKEACVKNGQKEASLKITYTVEKKTLTIKVESREISR